MSTDYCVERLITTDYCVERLMSTDYCVERLMSTDYCVEWLISDLLYHTDDSLYQSSDGLTMITIIQ